MMEQFCCGRKKPVVVFGKKKVRACYRRVNPLPGTCCSPYELPVTLLYFLGIISISLTSCAVRYILSPFRGGKEGVDLLAIRTATSYSEHHLLLKREAQFS